VYRTELIAMVTAAKILIMGGMLNLALAFALGFALARQRATVPQRPGGYLLNSHRTALWHGFMHLGLVFAVQLSDLSASLETLAAWLVVVASALGDATEILSWLKGIQDQLVERPWWIYMGLASAFLTSAGVGILLVGDFLGL